MNLLIDVTLDYAFAEAADVLLQIEAAHMTDQRLIRHNLLIGSPGPLRAVIGEESIGQRTWTVGEGSFQVSYSALVAVERPPVTLAGLAAVDPRNVPALVIPYMMPSRFVESDKFQEFVQGRFGDLDGGDKILAMLDWLQRAMAYIPGASDGATTAAMTFVQRQGVCRDYAHLLAAFVRAAGIPARLVSAYAPDVTPPDFHAVVEVWLADGWHLVDATGMARAEDIARIGTGRDATDIAFMTIFGRAEMRSQFVNVRRAD